MPALETEYKRTMGLRELVVAEAQLARAAVRHLNDAAVGRALHEAAAAVAKRADVISAANQS